MDKSRIATKICLAECKIAEAQEAKIEAREIWKWLQKYGVHNYIGAAQNKQRFLDFINRLEKIAK